MNRALRRIIQMRIALISRFEKAQERGDVPGWVLVVLMTAGLVTVLWTVAGPRLSAMLSKALDAVAAH